MKTANKVKWYLRKFGFEKSHGYKRGDKFTRWEIYCRGDNIEVLVEWDIYSNLLKCSIANGDSMQKKANSEIKYTTLEEFLRDSRIEPMVRKLKLQKISSLENRKMV